jgi:hypothetical protein
MVNIISKKCQEESCSKIPNFNFPNEKNPIFCKKHSQPNMVNIVCKKCENDGCNKIPKYNLIINANSYNNNNHGILLINLKS